MSGVTKDRTFLNIALELGQLSTCDRAAIGAVITREGRCVSWGYNGAPPGMPHCEQNYHGWLARSGTALELLHEMAGQLGALLGDSVYETVLRHHGCRNATHAEANALAFAARSGISTEGGTLFVSQSPCVNCSRLLIAAGIVRVVYDTMYRDQSGLELLRSAGLEVVHAPSATPNST